ncbi:MAG: hypothetical protein HQL20_01100 [Candidatus Omnitrophica bacterium]|nr:hypothetical protein [Candidatus Omnitrophota bacterium]
MFSILSQLIFCRWIAIFLTGVLLLQSSGVALAAEIISSGSPLAASIYTIRQPALPQLKGLILNRQDPLKLAFILSGEGASEPATLDPVAGRRLAGYFLAALAISDKDIWVNLSAFEKDRTVPPALGTTPLGQDMLAQDYLLKQLTCELTNPDTAQGRVFWNKIYAALNKRFGTTDLPVDLVNKVWILPEKAVVSRRGNAVYVVEQKLKAMTETDYYALRRSGALAPNDTQDISNTVLREVILPLIDQEINNGVQFAPLRQIYKAMILAAWYKKNLRRSILGSAYADQSAVNGIRATDPTAKEHIYTAYLESFRQGAYNLIREEQDASSGENIARKYFSGGLSGLGPQDFSEISSRSLTSYQQKQTARPGDIIMGVQLRTLDFAGDTLADEVKLSDSLTEDTRLWQQIFQPIDESAIRVNSFLSATGANDSPNQRLFDILLYDELRLVKKRMDFGYLKSGTAHLSVDYFDGMIRAIDRILITLSTLPANSASLQVGIQWSIQAVQQSLKPSYANNPDLQAGRGLQFVINSLRGISTQHYRSFLRMKRYLALLRENYALPTTSLNPLKTANIAEDERMWSIADQLNNQWVAVQNIVSRGIADIQYAGGTSHFIGEALDEIFSAFQVAKNRDYMYPKQATYIETRLALLQETLEKWSDPGEELANRQWAIGILRNARRLTPAEKEDAVKRISTAKFILRNGLKVMGPNIKEALEILNKSHFFQNAEAVIEYFSQRDRSISTRTDWDINSSVFANWTSVNPITVPPTLETDPIDIVALPGYLRIPIVQKADVLLQSGWNGNLTASVEQYLKTYSSSTLSPEAYMAINGFARNASQHRQTVTVGDKIISGTDFNSYPQLLAQLLDFSLWRLAGIDPFSDVGSRLAAVYPAIGVNGTQRIGQKDVNDKSRIITEFIESLNADIEIREAFLKIMDAFLTLIFNDQMFRQQIDPRAGRGDEHEYGLVWPGQFWSNSTVDQLDQLPGFDLIQYKAKFNEATAVFVSRIRELLPYRLYLAKQSGHINIEPIISRVFNDSTGKIKWRQWHVDRIYETLLAVKAQGMSEEADALWEAFKSKLSTIDPAEIIARSFDSAGNSLQMTAAEDQLVREWLDRNNLKWPVPPDVANLTQSERLKFLTRYLLNLYKIIPKFDDHKWPVQIQYPLITEDQLKFPGLGDTFSWSKVDTWQNWFMHTWPANLTLFNGGIEFIIPEIEKLENGTTKDPNGTISQIAEYFTYVTESMYDVTTVINMLSDMQGAIINNTFRTKWPEGIGIGSPIKSEDKSNWFIYQIFNAHSNAITHRAVLKKIVLELDRIRPDWNVALNEFNQWIAKIMFPHPEWQQNLRKAQIEFENNQQLQKARSRQSLRTEALSAISELVDQRKQEAKERLHAQNLIEWARAQARGEASLMLPPVWSADNTRLGELNNRNRVITLTPEVAYVIEEMTNRDYPIVFRIFKDAVRHKAGIAGNSKEWKAFEHIFYSNPDADELAEMIKRFDLLLALTPAEQMKFLAMYERYNRAGYFILYEAQLYDFYIDRNDLFIQAIFGKGHGWEFIPVANKLGRLRKLFLDTDARSSFELSFTNHMATMHAHIRANNLTPAIKICIWVVERFKRSKLSTPLPRILALLDKIASNEPALTARCNNVKSALIDQVTGSNPKTMDGQSRKRLPTDSAEGLKGGIDFAAMGYTINENTENLDLAWPSVWPYGGKPLNDLTPIIIGYARASTLPGLIRPAIAN